MVAVTRDNTCEALEQVGYHQVRLHLGGTAKGIVQIPFGRTRILVCDCTLARVMSASDRGHPAVIETVSSAQRRASTRSPRASATSAIEYNQLAATQ